MSAKKETRSRTDRISLAGALFVLASFAGIFLPPTAAATVTIALRSSRTCDNCHLEPKEWINPPLGERKCNMSCQACHVDPAGGGLRNGSGRFYGRSTLPMIATSPRPTRDWDREAAPFLNRLDRATVYNENFPRGPNSWEESFSPDFAPSDRWAIGAPIGGTTRYGPTRGRYGDLNAQPLLRIGWDARLALLSSGTPLFPMQIDLPVALNPIRHLTFFVNTGARGRSSGYADTFDSDHSVYFREAFILIHETPYQSYLKAGRFVPAFGLRLDDHTSQNRRGFELDGALPESRVTGVEFGTAPNYPFLNVSWFRSAARGRAPSRFDITDVDAGEGWAANLGIRELGWTVGASALLRRRPLNEGGDGTSWSVYGGFNPWFYSRRLPFQYQGEIDWGSVTRESGLETARFAAYHELTWLYANGVNLLATYDFLDPDREVIDDDAHRFGFGAQIVPVPGITIDGRIRLMAPAGGESGADLLLQLHLWN